MELITGGTGIVGTHVLLARTLAGAHVRALYRPTTDRSIVEKVFRHYRPDTDELLARIEWVEGDLHSMDALEDAMDGVAHVYHAAAMVSFDPRDVQALHRINAGGTANVVNAALQKGVKRLCHVSSIATIGDAPGDVLRDEGLAWTMDKQRSAYAISKYEAELEVHRGIAEGLDAVIVNPCVVLGPGASGRSSMTLMERLQKGSRFFPPGSNAFVDARDVAECMQQLMVHGETGERYLLIGENMRYKELFTEAAIAFGHPPPTQELSPWVLNLAWRAERIRTLLTGSRPLVTRATVHSAVIHRRYSNKKVITRTGHAFRSVMEAVGNVAAYLKR